MTFAINFKLLRDGRTKRYFAENREEEPLDLGHFKPTTAI